MSSINFHTKEISVKIVYYGPGLCGKTTSLQTIYASLPTDKRPQLVSLATEVDRTIFFDFLPVTAYRIREFLVRLQLYTVPGQVFYNATRKLVLNGVDGLVFVLDSQRSMKDSNLESLQNLDDNLAELGLEIARVPMVMQYNKRDLLDVMSKEEMERTYNAFGVPAFATIATRGDGLFDALKTISQLVVNDLMRKGLGRKLVQPTPEPVPPPPSAPVPAGGLWPDGEVAKLGERIEVALRAGRWPEVVYGVEQLLQLQAQLWAAAEGVTAQEPLAQFLLMRGVAPARYRALWEAGRAIRESQSIGRQEAMNALVLALETIW